MTVLVNPTALSDHKARDFKMLIDGKWEAGRSDPIERVAPSHGRRKRLGPRPGFAGTCPHHLRPRTQRCEAQGPRRNPVNRIERRDDNV